MFCKIRCSDELKTCKIRHSSLFFLIFSSKTRKREIEGLLLAHRKTQCTDLLLLTDHEYNQVTEKGLDIKIRPVYDWVVEMGKRI